MKVRVLIPYYSNEGGKTVKHKKGDIIEISDNVAHKFIKAGFAENVGTKAVKSWQ